MNKINTLESVTPHSGQYTFKKDLKLNVWIVVGAMTYVVTRYLLRHYPDDGVVWRVTLSGLPLIPFALWIRSLVRFLRSLDELQRHLQLKVWLMAALGTIAAETAVNILSAQGANIEPLGIVEVLAFMIVLWVLGCFVSVRRYR